MSSCPNCHQIVAPTDDICENCGAVLLSMIATPTFVAAPSASLQNDRVTKLLRDIVLRDANGTIRLNQQADAVAKKTLAINVSRTSKLK